MDVKKLAARLASDEGLTDGLADAEARTLLAWLTKSAAKRLADVHDEAQATKLVDDLRRRGRGVAKTLAALCEDRDPKAAQAAWAALGHQQPLDKLPAMDPAAALAQLLAWEEARHA